MRIHEPTVIFDEDAVTLSARVDLERASSRYPDRVWFKVPSRFEPLLTRGIEPFVVALSSLAAAHDEPIEVSQAVSERLSVGLDEYWAILSGWAPRRFRPLRLRAAGLVADEPHANAVAAAAFSGGVDSFYTLYSSLDKPPSHRVRYALFIHGFDIPLNDRRTYEAAAAAYEEALGKLGVSLVRVETNLRQFVPPAHWEMGHGSALIGTGLLLSRGARRFLVPSSKSYPTLDPWGSDPLVDGLLSTDGMQVIHDGARCSRFDKLQIMRDWPVIRPLLRTCYERPDAFRNCGHCHNCRRTMLVLASLGVLDRFPTFPQTGSALHFLNSLWETPHERLFGGQAIREAAASGKAGLAWVGRVAMLTSRVRQVLGALKKRSRPFRNRLKLRVQRAGGVALAQIQ
jgi:hypothetical protein